MRSEPVYRRRRAVALLIVGSVLGAGGWLSLGGGEEPAAAQPGDPQQLIVARTKTDSVVKPVTMGADLALAPPRDPKTVGWWQEGPQPGDEHGTAVFTGHSVHGGGGVFDNLEALRPGDQIEVVTDAGRLRYQVRRVEIVDRETLTGQSSELFATAGPGRIALVTCENWNGRSYDANVVVIATPV